MRTPYQIKRALAKCRDDHCICDECVFSDGNVKKWRNLMGDALIYIEQLEHSVDVASVITGETSDEGNLPHRKSEKPAQYER